MTQTASRACGLTACNFRTAHHSTAALCPAPCDPRPSCCFWPRSLGTEDNSKQRPGNCVWMPALDDCAPRGASSSSPMARTQAQGPVTIALCPALALPKCSSCYPLPRARFALEHRQTTFRECGHQQGPSQQCALSMCHRTRDYRRQGEPESSDLTSNRRSLSSSIGFKDTTTLCVGRFSLVDPPTWQEALNRNVPVKTVNLRDCSKPTAGRRERGTRCYSTMQAMHTSSLAPRRGAEVT